MKITKRVKSSTESLVNTSEDLSDELEQVAYRLNDDILDIIKVKNADDTYTFVFTEPGDVDDRVDDIEQQLYELGYEYSLEDSSDTELTYSILPINYVNGLVASTKTCKASEDFDDEDFDDEEFDDEEFDENEEGSKWVKKESKSVPDASGFSTDYTMYENIFHIAGVKDPTGEPNYVFVLGDEDLYSPDDGDFDWECDTEGEAYDWFYEYEGFTDDEGFTYDDTIEESEEVETCEDAEPITADENTESAEELSDEEEKSTEIDDKYLKDLQDSVDSKLGEYTISSAWNIEEDILNLTTNSADNDNINSYDIPMTDLKGDIDTDTDYIMGAVGADYKTVMEELNDHKTLEINRSLADI